MTCRHCRQHSKDYECDSFAWFHEHLSSAESSCGCGKRIFSQADNDSSPRNADMLPGSQLAAKVLCLFYLHFTFRNAHHCLFNEELGSRTVLFVLSTSIKNFYFHYQPSSLHLSPTLPNCTIPKPTLFPFPNTIKAFLTPPSTLK